MFLSLETAFIGKHGESQGCEFAWQQGAGTNRRGPFSCGGSQAKAQREAGWEDIVQRWGSLKVHLFEKY